MHYSALSLFTALNDAPCLLKFPALLCFSAFCIQRRHVQSTCCVRSGNMVVPYLIKLNASVTRHALDFGVCVTRHANKSGRCTKQVRPVTPRRLVFR